jgi:stage IV sporulation protein FB
MRDLLGWKLSFGRYAGTQVSVHLFFLLFAFWWLYQASKFPEGLVWYGVIGLAVLVVSVLLHEVGHALAARGVGGECAEILLAPWGGLAGVELPRWEHDDHTAAQNEILTAIAGPAVNFLICAVTAPILIAWKAPLTELLNPLAPPGLAAALPGFGSAPLFVVSFVFWLNFVLLAFNLIPSFPMDGGRIVRGIIWKWHGQRAAIIWSAWIGKFAAVALLIVGLFLPDAFAFAKVTLVLLAVFLFISARAELGRLQEQGEDEAFMGYDFSQGYTSLERDVKAPPEPKLGPVRKWLENRRMAKEEKQRQSEAADEARLDDILARLHESGREGLSDEDRGILDRVSARYRQRLNRPQ